MADAALSPIASPIASPLAALLTVTPAESAATGTAASTTDPFAGLLASAATVQPDGASIKSLPLQGVITPRAPRLALPLAPATSGDILIARDEAGNDIPPPATDDSSDDPLGDAIASGPTAVLAFAPAIAPAAPPQPIEPAPVAIDAPMETRAGPKSPPIGMPVRMPVNDARPPLPAYTPLASDAGQSAVSEQPQTFSAAPTQPVAAQLSPETVKAVIVALKGGDKPAETDKIAAQSPPTETQAAPAPAVQPAMPQTASRAAERPAMPTAVPTRTRGETAPIVRRTVTEPRRRTEQLTADAMPSAIIQRAVEAPRAPLNAIADTAPPQGDTVIAQTLAIARDGVWLDTLARDIARSADSGADLHFKLEPQNLGALTVAIAQGDEGASIRLTAETATTRDILRDAQPQLIAEARAHGLKVSETHVELENRPQNQGQDQDSSRWSQGQAGQQSSTQNGQNRQSSPAHQPFVSNLGGKSDGEAESSSGDSDALYA